ncbi:MAG: radical SAM family heme chaperone HemW [Candidatus Koribacter versatilis]|uniref:Heme chaperone HemW n=1 Tax=Candidatus Korobacter versatilis TaxID=658062 RepID=A0A932EPP3_9BACT|nr:radical SAM family heme chaperone HemW [Candidatus Koribacter versatilis]
MNAVPIGVYISVPFCRTKCSFCNFASDVFSQARFDEYVARVCADVAAAERMAEETGGILGRAADSIYLGGGTPSVLAPEQLEKIFAAVRSRFNVAPDAEITVECAPGTVSDQIVASLLRCGVNRVSLGVQSFVDKESRAVGRLHTRDIALRDIERLRAAGITELNLDLIAGLPHQTPESWRRSLAEVVASGAPHASVYMLEVDDDSRLGRELIAGGTRYHAHFVPDEDTTAAFYEEACAVFGAAGIPQYEISNFARPGHESRHNLKYWLRQPYLGFGVDAASMLHAGAGAVRFSTADNLEEYTRGGPVSVTPVSEEQALEEAFFLGLRLNRGIDLRELRMEFGPARLMRLEPVLRELMEDGLLVKTAGRFALSPRGRMVSNEVFERFLATEGAPAGAVPTAASP